MVRARRPVQPLPASAIAAVAALLGGFAAFASTILLGEAVGSMVRDSLASWTDEGWGAVLCLSVGTAAAAFCRRAPNAEAFWAAWSLVALATVALYSGSLAIALLAAAVPFGVAVRPAPAALRLVAGGMAMACLMVAAAVATERWGTWGTAAGLGWVLLSAAYFAVWASRESSPRATALAWALGTAWVVLCTGVAVSDAVRFHDTQAWAALGTLAAAGLALAASAWWSMRGGPVPASARPAA